MLECCVYMWLKIARDVARMVGMISYAGFVQFLEFKSHMIFRPGMSWNQAMVLESHGNVNSW